MTTPTPTPPHPARSPLVKVPCLEGQVIAFTGTLASMTHEQAAELARGHGGEPQEHVSRAATTILVVGDEGWPLEDNGQPSVKFEQAERLRTEGKNSGFSPKRSGSGCSAKRPTPKRPGSSTRPPCSPSSSAFGQESSAPGNGSV